VRQLSHLPSQQQQWASLEASARGSLARVKARAEGATARYCSALAQPPHLQAALLCLERLACSGCRRKALWCGLHATRSAEPRKPVSRAAGGGGTGGSLEVSISNHCCVLGSIPRRR
jgi:hypothetical protein